MKHGEHTHTHTTPLGDLVWVSNTGKVRDAETIRDLGVDLGVLAVEERALGQCDPEGIPFIVKASCEDTGKGAPNTSGVPVPIPESDSGKGYVVLSHTMEPEMLQMEDMVHTVSLSPSMRMLEFAFGRVPPNGSFRYG